MNIDPSYETEGTADASSFSLGVKITSNGRTAYLAGGIWNIDGDEDHLAQMLGHVDFMKLGHHGYPGSNTIAYMKSLSPAIAFQTGKFNFLSSETIESLIESGSQIYSSDEQFGFDGPAFVISFSNAGGVEINSKPSGLQIVHNEYSNCYEALNDNQFTDLTGWYETDAGYAYFEGSPKSSTNKWIKQGDAYLYVGDDSLRAQGWKCIDGTWYLFDNNGIMQTGWQLVSGTWYWFDDSGAMATGLAWTDGIISKFSSNGARLGYLTSSTGWNNVDGNWYYVSADGRKETGWLQNGGTWYWLDMSGKMTTGWNSISGNWYYFEPSGAMETGWISVGGQWYWFDSSGTMATGWKWIGASWYLLSDSGAMKTGWALDNGSWYWLDASGAMKTGWLYLSGTWYLLNSSGSMETGWQLFGGHWYYLDNTGAMNTGWRLDGDNWYYLAQSGSMEQSTWIGNYYVLEAE